MTKPPNLKLVLTLVISLLAAGLTGVVTLAVGRAGMSDLEESVSKSLALLADQMQDKLDRLTFERLREIANTASMIGTLGLAENPEAVRSWLEQVKGSGGGYDWIGFINRNGVIINATGGDRVGEDVAKRTWFRAATGEETQDERLDSSLHRAGTAILSAEAGRSLDIAQPVLSKNGEIVGVLAAQIGWNWVGEIHDDAIASLKRDHAVDVMVIGPASTVILGPPDRVGKAVHVSTGAAPMEEDGVFEGRRSRFVYAKASSQDVAGLGWSVLVRQDAGVALAPVLTLRDDMIVWGLGFSLLAAIAAWILAGRIAAPLLRLAHAAQSIQQGTDMPMPRLSSYAEVEILSRSLGLLVRDLKERERALATLNETLEAQIVERTGELAARNQALVKAYAEAEAATRAKSRFLAAASHDLRQPLHAMSLFTRALSRRVSGQEAIRLVSQLEEALTSLRTMFEALLNISRLDAGMIEPNIADIPVKPLIERVSSGFRAEAESAGLRFHSRGIDARLRTDPALLETMLRNLLSNALKFTRRGGIALIAHRSGAAIAFEVVDTGPGIGEDRRERIFEEFERSREHAFGHNDGLGLGLSIVRRYATLLGIAIRLTTRPGRGTRFTLTVPSAADAEGLALPAARHGRNGTGENGTGELPAGLSLLVVDDDPMIVSALTQDLADRGCKVQGATSPKQAEAILGAVPAIDAMILDFDLGCAETGLEFFSRMQELLARPVPGLILTGGTDATTLSAILASHLPWLTKPADPDMIAEKLAQLIGGGTSTPDAIANPLRFDGQAEHTEN